MRLSFLVYAKLCIFLEYFLFLLTFLNIYALLLIGDISETTADKIKNDQETNKIVSDRISRDAARLFGS